MIISDVFRWNDWNIRRFNIFVLCLLIAYDFSFISNLFLYDVKILPQILGFFIISFIPGYIILRIFKIHDIDRVITFLLAIGLSLSFIMIFGFSINIFLPYLGISKPISTFPLLCALNITILILLIICNLFDKEFSSLQNQLCIVLSPMLLFLFLLPILSIFGTYFMNYYNSNVLLLILLFIFSIFPLLVALNKLSTNLYPLSIFSISISILYGINLISSHLWSFDIFYEAYSTNYVLENGIWNLNIESIMPLLLFTILSPIYSLICNLNVVWVFKIIFPFIFSLTPLALYQIYKKLDFGNYKLDSKMAILSVFVFIFFYGFFKSMPDKQHIAELFLTFILMLYVISTQKRIILLLIFSFSLVTSHYGISYLFMFSVLFFIFIIKIFKIDKNNHLLTSNFFILFSILTLSWYIYVSSGYIFENVIHIGDHFLSSISEILKPDARSGITYALYESNSALWTIYKLLHICLQFFIFIGFFNLLTSIIKEKVNSLEIAILSIAFYTFLLLQVTKTYGMGFDRIFQITLILLSPLALWGFITIIKFLNIAYINILTTRLISNKISEKLHLTLAYDPYAKKNSRNVLYKKGQLLFAIFLMVFFLFNSGFVFEVAGDKLPDYCINLNKSAGWPVYSESEVCGVNWLKYRENEHNSIAVFNKWRDIKSRDGLLVSEKFYSKNLIPIQVNIIKLDNAYIFLGVHSMNVVKDDEKNVELKNTKFYKYILKKSGKIYDSGKSNLYLNK